MKKTIIKAARTSADAAARVARLATLKGQIEGIKRMDLVVAYADLGRKACEHLASSDRFHDFYERIAGLEREMAQKRQGARVDPFATILEKVKTMASSAKRKVEAEALAFKRRTLLESLGRAITEANLDIPELAPEQEAVARLLSRLAELSREYDSVKTRPSPAPPAPPPEAQPDCADGAAAQQKIRV